MYAVPYVQFEVHLFISYARVTRVLRLIYFRGRVTYMAIGLPLRFLVGYMKIITEWLLYPIEVVAQAPCVGCLTTTSYDIP
jgi:hypothetical protein